MISDQKVQARKGLLLALRVGRFWGLGEASPLEGWNGETLGDCLGDCHTLKKILTHRSLPLEQVQGVEDLGVRGFGLIPQEELLALGPLVLQALESCLLMILCQTQLAPLIEARMENKELLMRSCGLFPIPDPHESVNHSYSEAFEFPFETLKIKVGHHAFDYELSFLQEMDEMLKERWGRPTIFRLDGGQRLNWKKLERMEDELQELQVEYWEDPLDWSEFAPEERKRLSSRKWPWALDSQLHLTDLPPLSNFQVIVHKPGTLYGISDLVNRFLIPRNAPRPVFSSAYNTEVTFCMFSLLVALFPEKLASTCHGLDTMKAFQGEILGPTFGRTNLLRVPFYAFREPKLLKGLPKILEMESSGNPGRSTPGTLA